MASPEIGGTLCPKSGKISHFHSPFRAVSLVSDPVTVAPCSSAFRRLRFLCPLHLVGKCLLTSLYCGCSGFAVRGLLRVFNLLS